LLRADLVVPAGSLFLERTYYPNLRLLQDLASIEILNDKSC
jgi:hypothetical protein